MGTALAILQSDWLTAGFCTYLLLFVYSHTVHAPIEIIRKAKMQLIPTTIFQNMHRNFPKSFGNARIISISQKLSEKGKQIFSLQILEKHIFGKFLENSL